MSGTDSIHEIERKFLMLVPAAVIERKAVEGGRLSSRRLIQQRYLPVEGWRLRAVRRTASDGTVGHEIVLKRREDGDRLSFWIDDRAWTHLTEVCGDVETSYDDGVTVERIRLTRLRDWIVRLRRSTSVANTEARHWITLKRKITMAKSVEIESTTTASDHDAAIGRCGAVLRKRRICVRHAGRTWEIDTFLNPELDGMELAEVELPSEDACVSLPDWVGIEVTEDREYKNARIVRRLAA